jgi:sterol desaturase/sphingolipid hydroxylase (fatty acid hydroxylase superfamily)
VTADLNLFDAAQRTFDRVTRSRVNYYTVPIVDVAGAALLLALGVRSPLQPLAAIGALTAGLAAWVPVEYALHRWLGHGPPSSARRGHAMHHSDDAAPVAAPIFVVFGFVLAIWGALTFVMPAGAAALFMAGIYVGYNYYTLVHHLLHHRAALVERIGWKRKLLRHRIHHARHDVNFGVTSHVCDRLFKTFVSGLL